MLSWLSLSACNITFRYSCCTLSTTYRGKPPWQADLRQSLAFSKSQPNLLDQRSATACLTDAKSAHKPWYSLAALQRADSADPSAGKAT